MKRYAILQKTGKNIKRLRTRRKMTQEELAEKVKMHVSTLGRIERGQINPPLKTLEKIAYTLGVKTKELLP